MFTREDDGKVLRCVVKPKDGRGRKVTRDRPVHVNWQYVTSVEADPTPVNKGDTKTMTCRIEDVGKPGREQAIRWIRDGLPVKGSDRHEGTNTKVSQIGGGENQMGTGAVKREGLV